MDKVFKMSWVVTLSNIFLFFFKQVSQHVLWNCYRFIVSSLNSARFLFYATLRTLGFELLPKKAPSNPVTGGPGPPEGYLLFWTHTSVQTSQRDQATDRDVDVRATLAPRPPPPPLLWTTCCLRDNAWAFKQSASPSEGSGSWVRAALVFLWSYVLSRIMVAASHTCFSRSLGQQASNMEDKTIKLQNYRNYFYYIFIPLFNKSQ